MKELKIEIKPSNANITDQDPKCWDVYLNGKLHFSTTIDREYLESHMVPEWLRHIEEDNELS
jgi:predicted membrane-bound spermidine synthase